MCRNYESQLCKRDVAEKATAARLVELAGEVTAWKAAATVCHVLSCF
jgi:hypothetical protein